MTQPPTATHTQETTPHCEQGLVTVVMPCYNAAEYIAEAIDSVLHQSYPHVELIVVDDGSTDDSVAVVQRYQERLRLIQQPNKGASAARNRGIVSGTGEYLAFLDADDFWHPDFLARMIEALRSSDAVLAYCGWQIIERDGRGHAPFIPPDYENERKHYSLLSNASLWPIHGMLTFRRVVMDVGMFDEGLPACEDYDLWLRLAMHHRIVRVPASLAHYRCHKSLQETDKRAVDAEYLREIKRRYLTANPDVRDRLSPIELRDCIDGGFIRRGRQCLMRNEYKSAQRIFRTVWRERIYRLRDLPYVLPALLPERLFKKLAIKPRSP